MIERLYENPFDFFQELGDFYRAKGYSEAAHNRIQRYEILLEFLPVSYTHLIPGKDAGGSRFFVGRAIGQKELLGGV